MNRFNNIKLRNKLFLSYIFIMIIPLILLGVFSYVQSKNTTINRSVTYAQNNVDTFVHMTNSKINNLISSVNVIAYNSALADSFNTVYNNYYDMYEAVKLYVDPLLSSVKSANEDIDTLAIYTNSPITKRTNYVYSLGSLEYQPWYQQLQTSVGLQVFLSDDKVWFIQPLVASYSQIYTSYAVLTVSQMHLLNTSTYWEENCNFGLYNSKGNLVFENKTALLSMPQTVTDDFLSLSADSSYSYKSDVLTIKASNPILNMDFYFQQINRPMFWTTDSIIWATIAITLGCSLFVLLISLLLARMMVYRLEQLNQKIRLVDQGTLSVEITDPSQDEIGQLSTSFNHMLSTLRQLIQDIYQAERLRKEFEINLLHSKIKPHFLYNILSIINWKALSCGNKQISDVAISAASFYRTSLNDGKHIISVEKELENIKSYIKIQQIMHDMSFECTYHIDPTILSLEMPNFILQPIVENAIKHGLDNKRIGMGQLEIHAKQDIDKISFLIQDNGPGINPDILKKLENNTSTGYGLQNIRQKLSLYYGTMYSFSITSSPELGTTVSLKIPQSLPQNNSEI